MRFKLSPHFHSKKYMTGPTETGRFTIERPPGNLIIGLLYSGYHLHITHKVTKTLNGREQNQTNITDN
jgi:hypothetical protein